MRESIEKEKIYQKQVRNTVKQISVDKDDEIIEEEKRMDDEDFQHHLERNNNNLNSMISDETLKASLLNSFT